MRNGLRSGRRSVRGAVLVSIVGLSVSNFGGQAFAAGSYTPTKCSTTGTLGWHVIGDSISEMAATNGAGDAICYWAQQLHSQRPTIAAVGGAKFVNHRNNSTFSKVANLDGNKVLVALGTNDVGSISNATTTAARDLEWAKVKAEFDAAVAVLLSTGTTETKKKCVYLLGLNEKQDSVAGAWARYYSNTEAVKFNGWLKSKATGSNRVVYIPFTAFGSDYPAMLGDGIHPTTTNAKIRYAQTVLAQMKANCS